MPQDARFGASASKNAFAVGLRPKPRWRSLQASAFPQMENPLTGTGDAEGARSLPTYQVNRKSTVCIGLSSVSQRSSLQLQVLARKQRKWHHFWRHFYSAIRRRKGGFGQIASTIILT